MSTYVVKHEACPRCVRNGRDRSGNNLARYNDNSAFCFACGYTLLSEAYKIERGIINEESEEEEVLEDIKEFTEDAKKQIKSNTTAKGKGIRGLKDSTLAYFGVRQEIDTGTGEINKQIYPTTINNELTGYKIRTLPKKFSCIGETGKKCQLFGQFRFKTGGKYCLIVGGEVDQLSAYQMLRDYQISKGNEDYAAICVVSPTIGETGCAKQLQGQYDFLSQFERIVMGLDSDEAGKEATEKVVSSLPRGKVWVANWSYKDPNEYLMKGKEKEFVSDFFKATKYTPAGIVASSSIYEEIVAKAKVDKLSFPPFLDKLNKMLAGGIPYGFIVNLIAASGVGKSVFVNECLIHWITECNEVVGVVSLEADAGAYGENLLSRYMSKKITMIDNKEDKLAFVTSDEAQTAAKELFTKPDGSPSFMLLDDRGDFDKLQEKIEELVISFGVRVILIDVISDVFAGMPLADVDLFMRWEKNLVKQYNCIIVQVAHTRKSPSGEKAGSQGSFLSEESTIGSGTQYRSAGINISLQRDKTAENEEDRNTTKVHILKSRDTGLTGLACELYYCGETHTLHEKEQYLVSNGGTF